MGVLQQALQRHCIHSLHRADNLLEKMKSEPAWKFKVLFRGDPVREYRKGSMIGGRGEAC